MSIEDGDIVDGGSADTEVLEGVSAGDDTVDTVASDDAPDTGAAESGEEALTTDEAPDDEEEGPEADRAEPSAARQAAFAALRAAVVLVAAAVVYQLVVPTYPVVRARLSHLVINHPGVAAFNSTPPQAGEQDDSQTGLAAVTSAAKQSPNKTGFYTIAWAPSQTSGVGISVYLLPTDSIAATALSQVRAQQLAAGSYSSNGLARRSVGTVDGVPGSTESVFTSTARNAPKTTLVAVAFGVGRVNSVVVAVTSDAQSAAATVARSQYAHLKQVEPGFSLTITKRPVVESALWAAGAVVLAAIVAFGPIVRRRRARRRQQRYEEEMANRVVVHGQVIHKHRR